MIAAEPTAVLFACNLNTVRSPMAAALLRRLTGSRIRVDSCGLLPADDIDPFVLPVMSELGLDLGDHCPKSFETATQDPFDLVISLTPEAQARAVEAAPAAGFAVEYWPMPDPTLETGAREQRLDAYRGLRDHLDRSLRERFLGIWPRDSR